MVKRYNIGWHQGGFNDPAKGYEVSSDYGDWGVRCSI